MLLNQIFETKIVEGLNRTGRNDTAVIGWGRGMGHLGHMYLASSVITQANESKADPYFVVSRTVGKDDPLTPTEKLSIYKKVFAEHKQIFQSTSDAAPDLNRILGKLQEHGYKKVVVVLGEDQVNAFQYLKNYNGKKTKTGEVLYNFESIDVISRQQTNDPSKSLAGPRATDMRSVLLDPAKLDEDKFAVWRDAMSPKLNDNEVHMIMKLAEHRLKNLAEARLDPKNIAALSQLKQKLRSAETSAASGNAPLDADAQASVDRFAQKVASWMPDRPADNKSTSVPRTRMMPRKETNPVAKPEFPTDLKTLIKYRDTLDQVLATKEIIEKLKSRAEGFGPLPYGLQSDMDDSLYTADASKDGYQSILAKNQEVVKKLKDYINLKKSLYRESANNVSNEPYEYVVHYHDPKSKTSGTRTVKTTQPAPKSDSPEAKKFFGKWTGHYAAHEKRSDTANRAHDIVSHGVEEGVPGRGTVEEDWQKVNKSDKTDGMSKKAVSAYRRENPGSKLKTAVTKKPSELKPGSKDANRRKSFCARMSGVDGPMKDEKGRPTAKAKALNRWNCNEDVEEAKFEYTPQGTSLITDPEEYKRLRDQREIEIVFGNTPRHIQMARTGMYKKSIATPRQWKMLFDLTDEQGRFLPRMSKGHAAGAADKKAGKDINSNPFTPGSDEHKDWAGGWKSVELEGVNKKKGADGKACWKGYRYNGTENGKDKCVPVSEDVESIMGALIENILKK